MKPGSADSVTLRMDVSLDLYETLVRLSERSGRDIADLFSHAIVLAEIAIQADEQGKAFGVAASADVLERELVGIRRSKSADTATSKAIEERDSL